MSPKFQYSHIGHRSIDKEEYTNSWTRTIPSIAAETNHLTEIEAIRGTVFPLEPRSEADWQCRRREEVETDGAGATKALHNVCPECCPKRREMVWGSLHTLWLVIPNTGDSKTTGAGQLLARVLNIKQI